MFAVFPPRVIALMRQLEDTVARMLTRVRDRCTESLGKFDYENNRAGFGGVPGKPWPILMEPLTF